ncbi:MAG: hypothetical protein ACTH8G_07200 [Glutamicibacter arilaitensis]
MCDGWTVQDIAAHVISAPQLTGGAMLNPGHRASAVNRAQHATGGSHRSGPPACPHRNNAGQPSNPQEGAHERN